MSYVIKHKVLGYAASDIDWLREIGPTTLVFDTKESALVFMETFHPAFQECHVEESDAKPPRAPLYAGAVTITARKQHGSGYDYVATDVLGNGRRLRATSTSHGKAAAWSLALRIFWGGNTKATCSDQERSRTTLTDKGGGVFEATWQ